MPNSSTRIEQTGRDKCARVLRQRVLPLLALSFCLTILTYAQSGAAKKQPAPAPPPALTRTTTRHEVRRFHYGNSLVITGGPLGSITVEAWQRSEVDITADIELHADTEEDLARLASVNNFALEDDPTRLTITTVGTHDRKFMKRAAKDFPKKLIGLPWKIDYKLRVPVAVALDIYAGRGALNVEGIEGPLYINAGEAPTTLTLTGGDVQAVVGVGPVNLRIPAHSWRGRGVTLRLARGDLNVELPAAFNGDIDAVILRTGSIANQHPGVTPRERTTPTARTLQARVGAGGTPFSFEVTDGTITIKAVTSDK